VYPTLNPSFVPPAAQCIVGNSYNFSAAGQYASYSTFSWNFSSWATPATSTQQNPAGVSYNQYGNFPVTLTVKEKSCTKTYTDTVKVYPNTLAHFQADTAKGCQPLTVSFTNTSTYGAGTDFTWYFGNGDTLHALNALYTYQDTGTYNITLVAATTSGCVGTSSTTVNGLVTVYPGPKAGFVASPAHTNIYYSEITFTDTSKNVTVQTVSLGDGTLLTSLPPTHDYSNYGTYVITQIALSSNGCSDTATQTIVIDPDFVFYVPNTFTPNGDIHNETFKAVTFAVSDFSMIIFDRWGREVFSSTDPTQGWDGNWRGKKCPEDVYVYKIQFTSNTDLSTHTVSGHVNLMR
jgi:gliding motility-associated-like protein